MFLTERTVCCKHHETDTLQMEAACFFETLRNITGDMKLRIYRCDNHKSLTNNDFK
jgi:hypothetical protein